jgi:hypothetical protein
MNLQFPSLCVVVFLLFACTQSRSSSDYLLANSTDKKPMSPTDCEDSIYTKVQNSPKIKISLESYSDSIMIFLRSKGVSLKNVSIKLHFVVDCHSHIRDLEIASNDSSNNKNFKDAVLKYSGLWLPASQNNYVVTAYTQLAIKFENNKLVAIVNF